MDEKPFVLTDIIYKERWVSIDIFLVFIMRLYIIHVWRSVQRVKEEKYESLEIWKIVWHEIALFSNIINKVARYINSSSAWKKDNVHNK